MGDYADKLPFNELICNIFGLIFIWCMGKGFIALRLG